MATNSGEASSIRVSGIGSWRQRGRICLWRYKPLLRMYSGWHFTADAGGCDSVVELIGILTSGASPAHRTLLLTDPTPFGADRIFGEHALRVVSPAKLRLAFSGSRSGDEAELVEEEDRLRFTAGAADMNCLAEAVADLRRDVADFSISFGPDDRDRGALISFWWWPRGK